MTNTLNEKPNEETQFFERQIALILDGFIFSHEISSQSCTWRPPTDIYETDATMIVKCEIAGMTLNAFKISFVDKILTIRGVRKDLENKLRYHCLEIPYGEFQLRMLIPGQYSMKSLEANYIDGYLYVTLTKLDQLNSPQ